MTEIGQKSGNVEGDNILLGIALMLAFCVFIPFADALMKMLSASVPVVTLLVIRYTMQVILTIPMMLWHKSGATHLFHLSRLTMWRLFWRTVMHIAGISGMYFGLKHMPLADTTAIAFIFPLLMLFAGYFFMGEQVGAHRVVAALVGFIGTLLVVQPNFVEVGANVFWPIGTACSFVVFVLVTRQMSRAIDPISIQVVSGTLALFILSIPIFLFNGDGFELFDLIMPKEQDWPWLLLTGILGTFGHLLMTGALRFAPSATLAPMQYLEIPFATLIGWMVFAELPNKLAALGIAITISAGLYIIKREQRAQNAAKGLN